MKPEGFKAKTNSLIYSMYCDLGTLGCKSNSAKKVEEEKTRGRGRADRKEVSK